MSNNKLLPVAVFDLDNCLSDDEWRHNLIDFGAADMTERYRKYHAACGRDIAVARTVKVLVRHLREGHAIAFVTARPVSVRAQTVDWILGRLSVCIRHEWTDVVEWEGWQNARNAYALIMRNDGDNRSSVDVKRDAVNSLPDYFPSYAFVAKAYDDRQDIVDMYRSMGIPAEVLKIHDTCMVAVPQKSEQDGNTASVILHGMAKTFEERNAVYKDNYKLVGKLMAVLYPNGLPGSTERDYNLTHLWVLILVKLTRFVASGHSHRDSVHDIAVYAAMIEAILNESDNPTNQKGTQQ